MTNLRTQEFSPEKRVKVEWAQVPLNLLFKLVTHSEAFHEEVQTNRRLSKHNVVDSSRHRIKRKRKTFEKTKWG